MGKAIHHIVIALGLCCAMGAAWSAEPSSEAAASTSENAIDPAHEQALAAYVQGRFSRVKRTVDEDRTQARRYMSRQFAERYEADFNPSVALPEFKACEDCEQFQVRITRMQHELHDATIPWTAYSTNVSYIEFVTVPIAPADAEPRVKAVQLDWTPKETSVKTDAPLEITREDMLVHRQRISM